MVWWIPFSQSAVHQGTNLVPSPPIAGTTSVRLVHGSGNVGEASCRHGGVRGIPIHPCPIFRRLAINHTLGNKANQI